MRSAASTRYCERYYAKGPRRRPVRIEFCEADILDLFDAWRRAVGVAVTTEHVEPAPRKPPLAGHIERASARLTATRADGRWSAQFNARLDAAVRELEGLAGEAKKARGEARAQLIDRLAALDADLLAAAVDEIDPQQAQALKREAEAELAPFGSRMAPEVRDRAIGAAHHRLVREALGVPVIRYE